MAKFALFKLISEKLSGPNEIYPFDFVGVQRHYRLDGYYDSFLVVNHLDEVVLTLNSPHKFLSCFVSLYFNEAELYDIVDHNPLWKLYMYNRQTHKLKPYF